jgi:hypothetical protein
LIQRTLERIETCASEAGRNELSRNLLYAYVACLTPAELCDVAVHALGGSAQLIAAVRTRIHRLATEGMAISEVEALAWRLIEAAREKTKVRAESFLSHVYPFLGASTRQRLLERWRDKGTRGAAARWLKAVSSDELLLAIDEVLDYWWRTRDRRAEKLLVSRASPDLISSIMAELIDNCEEGWIASRAVLRASFVSEECWTAIRTKFPATYAYLCVKTGRSLSEQDAFAVVEESDGMMSDRGLAIWAVGQLGMKSVLYQV